MTRFRLGLALVMITALAASVSARAQVQPDSLLVLNAVGSPVNALVNVRLKKVSLTSVSFEGKDGKALASGNQGFIDIGGTTYRLSAPKAITLPNQSVFGGVSSDLDVYFYVAGLTGGATALCLSDANSLLTKGVVATTNTGFVSCPGVTVPSTAKLRLLAKCTYDNATQLTSAACSQRADAGLNTFP